MWPLVPVSAVKSYVTVHLLEYVCKEAIIIPAIRGMRALGKFIKHDTHEWQLVLFKDTTILAISQLFPLGEGKEEPWTARKHQLKLDTLPKSVTDETGNTTDRESLASLENSSDTGNKQNLKEIKKQAV